MSTRRSPASLLGLLTPARPFGGREVIETTRGPPPPLVELRDRAAVRARQRRRVPRRRQHRPTRCDSPIAWGIVLGLVVGKPLGILAATALALRLRLGRLPDGVGSRTSLAAGAAAGIGFTVSLFVADLAFSGVRLDDAKVAILVASVISGAIGVTLLLATTRRAVS